MAPERERSPRRRYRFDRFTLSPTRRQLTCGGLVVPLIPRYFDLLLLLVERRDEALHRHVILDAVWSDVVVSDGALSQAVRSLRRALGDDPRAPHFIRTVSRHGYQFVHPQVVEEDDEAPPLPAGKVERALPDPRPATAALLEEEWERLLQQLVAPPISPNGFEGDPRREAAEALHAMGTTEALSRLGRRPGWERAQALLRDARWDVAGAGEVPILGLPGAARVTLHLVRLRLRRAVREVGERWAAAACGGAVAGALGGLLGGLTLWLGPGSLAGPSVSAVLALLGAAVGGLGGAGVGAGLAAAEAVFRSARSLALVLLGGLAGGAVGSAAHVVVGVLLESLFGHSPSPLAGGVEGLAIGAGVGLGYAVGTRLDGGGMAAPLGGRRLVVALLSGLGCGGAAAALALGGLHTGALSLDVLARSFPGSRVGLEPLARLLGEAAPGLLTATFIAAGEGLLLGGGVALGLTRRPRHMSTE